MRRMMAVTGILALMFLAALAVPAQAALINFTANLDGFQEVPPHVTPATGLATLVFDDVLNIFDLDLSVSGMLAPITAYHIHAAPPGVNGPVIVSLVGLDPSLVGSTAGSIHLDDIPFPLANVADLLAGDTYVNVHTTLFPGGEIRAQLVEQQVPGPATLLLLGGGLAAIGVLGWAHRNA
ncbi:MAG: CHRD domain-containing protein [Candidatus Rokubacteria bacterium]|nr:CHRD domain-containing protein [Candidatus Rokubacteria bacterium]